ncbi:26S proteasome non-ATPase regulatory subunit 6 [Histomonas meleagridis]|uniref:26S proteasome non-ATPase regulatory subunit 6 n=1 Tax=Histomonas meleagridis TaxID=135588 RepID=UPI00355A24E1|nr:26S proteasome non-ATPase regulatory subunit 6 [Histomonas meleagridis]KAH0797856.1 26S proteasome non-ATPase regulatory subunit 6 [Histomonas meleagridis]
MAIAQLRERYAMTRSPADETALMEAICENKMCPYYYLLCQQFDWQVDEKLAAELSASNDAELADLQHALADAKEAKGEEDVRVALQNLALFYLKIGDCQESKRQLSELFSHTIALGQKLDVVFCQMRISFFYNDHVTFKELLDQAQSLIKEGGDWERKNRLKVYEGLNLCVRRNFVAASLLFISTLSTFTATELMEYDDFVYRTVLLCVLSLNRADFGAKIDRSMEVRAASKPVQKLLSLYHLKYSEFFDALTEVEQRMKSDIWFSRHLSYLIKELRVKAYNQYLEPYEALQITAMAQAFRVTPQFIEAEMRRFISSNKLSARIDRVSGTIHTNPPDSRATKMREALKGGEILISRLQKLGRILSA